MQNIARELSTTTSKLDQLSRNGGIEVTKIRKEKSGHSLFIEVGQKSKLVELFHKEQPSERILAIATLQRRREKLMSELDQITRPEKPVLQTACSFRGPGFEYQGQWFRHWAYIDIHIGLLRKLWNDFPERREAMASAMGRYGYSRNYVATSVDRLFLGMSEYKAKKFSRRLVDGWYVDSNINLERMRRILPAAVTAAGLKMGEDVRIYWRMEKS